MYYKISLKSTSSKTYNKIIVFRFKSLHEHFFILDMPINAFIILNEFSYIQTFYFYKYQVINIDLYPPSFAVLWAFEIKRKPNNRNKFV